MATLLILEPIFEADFPGIVLVRVPTGAISAPGRLEEIPRSFARPGIKLCMTRDLKGYFRFDFRTPSFLACVRMRGRGPIGPEADPDVVGGASRRTE